MANEPTAAEIGQQINKAKGLYKRYCFDASWTVGELRAAMFSGKALGDKEKNGGTMSKFEVKFLDGTTKTFEADSMSDIGQLILLVGPEPKAECVAASKVTLWLAFGMLKTTLPCRRLLLG